MNEPIFTLENRKISPYRDFLRMFFRMNRITDIVFLALIGAGLGYAIFLLTQPVDTLAILVFVTVGIAFLLLMALIFFLPFLHRHSSAKAADKIKILFYKDRLVGMPVEQEDMGKGTLIPYRDFTSLIETKTSLICIMGKAGVVLSKESGIPEEVLDLIRKSVG